MTDTPEPTTKSQSRWVSILKEVALTVVIAIVVISAIRMWQSRNLLEDDGSVEAPDIELRALDGEIAQLSSFKGKTILLHFWATW